MKSITTFSIVLFWLTAAFVLPSLAHNYHTSITRIDFNKKAKSLEIEINLFNHDVEKVFESKFKKSVDYEKKQEFEKMLSDYLTETFIVKDRQGTIKKHAWVGKEIRRDMTTVFIEVKGIENIEGFQIQNKIFFESFDEQTNLVTIHSGRKKYDLAFRVGDEFKKFVTGTKK